VNLESFLINIKVNLYNIRHINSSDNRVIDIISEIKLGKSLYESIEKYDSLNIVIYGSIDSVKLLGVFLDMRRRFKEQLIFSMFYPCFMNLLLVCMFIFIHNFFNIYVNIFSLIVSIFINALISILVIRKLFVKLKFIENICLWINVLRGNISIKSVGKLGIDLLNYSNVNDISYALFQCNNMKELNDKYENQNKNVENYFKASIQIISSLSVVIIGVNLCLVITNISKQHLVFINR
jgi:hypothetical protein